MNCENSRSFCDYCYDCSRHRHHQNSHRDLSLLRTIISTATISASAQRLMSCSADEDGCGGSDVGALALRVLGCGMVVVVATLALLPCGRLAVWPYISPIRSVSFFSMCGMTRRPATIHLVTVHGTLSPCPRRRPDSSLCARAGAGGKWRAGEDGRKSLKEEFERGRIKEWRGREGRGSRGCTCLCSLAVQLSYISSLPYS